MTELTTHERMRRMYAHQEADRVPVTDSPGARRSNAGSARGCLQTSATSTTSAWTRSRTSASTTARGIPSRVVEETDEYVINTTAWGATLKNWKHIASTPEFMDFTINDARRLARGQGADDAQRRTASPGTT